MIILITGPKDAGKTTFLRNYISLLAAKGESAGGILSLAEVGGGIKHTYYAWDIKTGNSWPLVSDRKFQNSIDYGRYSFSAEGYKRAGEVLQNARDCSHLIIDELGPVELLGFGFAEDLKRLLPVYKGELFIVVRESLVKEVIGFFSLDSREVKITSIVKDLKKHGRG